jgi:hypothetical protein
MLFSSRFTLRRDEKCILKPEMWDVMRSPFKSLICETRWEVHSKAWDMRRDEKSIQKSEMHHVSHLRFSNALLITSHISGFWMDFSSRLTSQAFECTSHHVSHLRLLNGLLITSHICIRKPEMWDVMRSPFKSLRCDEKSILKSEMWWVVHSKAWDVMRSPF